MEIFKTSDPASFIGLPEFESGTPSPPDLYANQLRYSPKCAGKESPIRLFTIAKKIASVNCVIFFSLINSGFFRFRSNTEIKHRRNLENRPKITKYRKSNLPLNKKTAPVSAVFALSNEKNYLKSFGRRSVRLHFEHSARFLIFPFSNMVFIMISPPQSGHMNLCVETDVREFLLAPAIAFLQNEFFLI